jgi:hypothetical protein
VPQEVLSRPGRFPQVNDHLEVQEGGVGAGARRRRDLVGRTREAAERQRQHRAEALAALRQERDRLEPQAPEHTTRACEWVASPRDGRDLRRGPGGRLAIDQAMVTRAARREGTSVLLTNDETLTPADVGLGSQAMRLIAAGFRRMKTTGGRLRPVDHGTAHRLVSHVQRCGLALLLQRAAESRTADTWRNVRLLLEEIKAVRSRVQGTTIVQSTRLTPAAAARLKKRQGAPPKRLLVVER